MNVDQEKTKKKTIREEVQEEEGNDYVEPQSDEDHKNKETGPADCSYCTADNPHIY